jgi:LysM repeat protein
VALVNALRASLGLSPFTVDPLLTYAAQSHATWIATTGQYSHTGEGGSTPQDRALAAGYAGSVAENFVAGTGLTPGGAVEWWRNSAIHYAALTSSAQHVGVGFARRGDNNIYVLVAGRPSPPPRPRTAGGAAEEEEEDEGPIVVPITRAEPDANGRIVHEVQQGQTAWAIAAVYGVDLDEMLRINNLTRPVVLRPGDKIIVRLGEGETPPPTPTPITEYTIQEGQTIWEVAVTHGLTVDQLLEYNGLTRQDVILPGTVLRLIPPEENAATPETPTPPVESAENSPTPTPAPVEAVAAAPGATFTAAPLPTSTLRVMPTITPAYSPTPTAPPPTLTPAVTSTAPLIVADTATPPSPTPAATGDDGDTDELWVVGLGVLGVVWLLVGGIGLASYVTRKGR